MQFFSHRFAARTAGVNPSAIREILKIVAQPDIISFAGGMPAPELFPAEALRAAAHEAFATPEKTLAALQYGPSEGYLPLRQWLEAQLAAEGIQAPGNNILITTGSQQAIDLVSRIYLDPGDEVVVGNPTFLGALQCFNGFQAKIVTAPTDAHGMKIEALARILENRKPKFIYAIPNFENPTGNSMSEDRKAELYSLARVHGVPILEDDPYGDLYFGATRPSTLKSLDHDNEGVILLRTFSKVLSPGLRVGYAVLPQEVQTRVLPAKQSADLHTTALAQVMIHEYLKTGALEGHLSNIRQVYHRRRDLMLAAMAKHFPTGCHWTKPDGGLFIWVTLPQGLSSAALLEEAIARKVAFIPGQPFYAHGGGENTFRLNFSNASEANIEEGIKRLGEVLRQALLGLGAPVA
ncbi:MAG: aminotransferase class [Cyanobacteria bacterium RYN_339]|nr:aminotransferase class [Cyanobacteria bacterium RYN_339]